MLVNQNGKEEGGQCRPCITTKDLLMTGFFREEEEAKFGEKGISD